MTGRQVRRGRRLIARAVGRDGRCVGAAILHRWVFDGYFWHHCARCGRVA